MIQSIRKVIKIGTGGNEAIPVKDLKQQNILLGDDIELIVGPLKIKMNKIKKL